jgi:hypothetical protein
MPSSKGCTLFPARKINNKGASVSIHSSAVKTAAARLALALTAMLGAAHVSAQPTLRVTAANSSAPNAVYDVLFGAQQTTLLNADGASASFQSFHSLVLVPNSTSGGVDAIVADTAGGTIVRYSGPTGTPTVSSTVVWSATTSNTPGPTNPDGLSVDAAGNLYAVTSSGPHGPQVWVLPVTPITAASPAGFGTPILLDQQFNRNEVDSLVETVVVPPAATSAAQAAYTNAGISAGDLLVLVRDNDFSGGSAGSDGGVFDPQEPALVYDYPVAGIQNVLKQALIGQVASVSPTILLWEVTFPYLSGAVPPVPTGAVPTGIDIWPIDGSLLISTNLGTILQYSLPSSATSSPTTFASVPCGATPCPFNKIRTGIQMNTAFAFATQSTAANSGNILYFSVPMTTPPTPTPAGGFGFTAGTGAVPTTNGSGATAGSPYGLAVAPATVVVASTTTCTSATGCNPTGALAHMIVPGATGVSGNILEQTCIFTDTRLALGSNGTCPGTLNIAQKCQGFAANTIPETMCGASGPNKNQFVAIQTTANGVDGVPGILVQTVQTPSALIPNTTDPSCRDQVLGWTTLLGSKEGTEPEGSNIIDMGSYCDNGGVTKGNSMWLIGGQLSPAVSSTTHELVAYSNQKLANLGNVVGTATIAKPAKTALQICLIASAVLLDTDHFACAARAVYTCDQLVAHTAQSYGSSPNNPNAYGDVRGRLGNLYFTINSRILHNSPNTSWPLQSPPAACDLR